MLALPPAWSFYMEVSSMTPLSGARDRVENRASESECKGAWPMLNAVFPVSSVLSAGGYQLEGTIHGISVPFLQDTGAAVPLL